LKKTFKVFRDKGKNIEKQKARGEEPDEVAAYQEAVEANKLTPNEKKALRSVESAAKDAQTAAAYEATTKRKISEETRPEGISTKERDTEGMMFREEAEIEGRSARLEFTEAGSDAHEIKEASLREFFDKEVGPVIAEKERILRLPNTVTRKGWREDVGHIPVDDRPIAAPFFSSKGKALEELKAQGKNPAEYEVRRVDGGKVITGDEIKEEWAVIKKSDELPKDAPIRRVDGGSFKTEAGLEAAIGRQGKNLEDFDIVTTSDGGFEGVPKVAEEAPIAKPPEYSPIDAAKASEDELDDWVTKNLGTSWRGQDIDSKRDYIANVQKSADSEEFVLRQAETAAEQKIRDAGMFKGGRQAAYSAVRLIKSMPELRAMVSRVARMGVVAAGGAGLSKKAIAELEKETKEMVGLGVEVAGGNKSKPVSDLDHFKGRVEDLKAVRNEAETLYGFFMEASGDVRTKVSNAVEARDNGSVMVTGADGTVTSMGPDEALTDLFSSLDRFLAVQELWADFGTQLSLGLRQRQDFYRTGYSALGRDIANQTRRIGFDTLNAEGGVAGKMAQKLYRNGVRSSMKESKFLRKMEMATKHDGATTPKSIGDSVLKSENHALANRLSEFVPSGKKLMAVTQEWYINALLGSPTTWSVNLLGNGLVMALRHFELSAGALLTGNTQLLKANMRALFDVHSFMDSLRYSIKAGWDDEAKSISGFTAYSDNRIRAQGEIFSEKGVGAEGNTFYKAINWLGKAVRHPTRILMAGDEFFKQMNFRAHAKTMLAVEGYQKGLHKTPKALANFVDDGFKGLVTTEGRFRNEANVLKEAHNDLAQRQQTGEVILPGKAEQEHIAKYMDDHYNSHELTLENGDIYNKKDLGQRNKLVEGATDWALINTFTNDPKNPLVKALNNVATFSPWLTFVVPFVRTPSNIITFALGRVLPTTPIGSLGKSAFNKARGKAEGLSEADHLRAQKEAEAGFLKGRKYDVEMPNADQMIAEKIELLNRAGSFEAAEYTGRLAFSGLAVGSVFLLVEGIKDKITGAAPTSKTKRAAWEMDGKQPYSIKLDLGGGERWYSYQRMDPFATILGIHADIVHGMIDSREDEGGAFGDEEEVEEKRPWVNRAVGVLAMSFANNVTNKSYVENLGSLLDLLRKPDQTGTQVAGQILAGFVPNGLNVSQNVFEEDPAILESRLLLDKLMKKIPEGMRPEVKEDKWYVSKKLMPRRNYLGEVKRKQHTGGLQSVLNPIFRHDVSDDIVDMEIASHGTGKGHMTPMLSVGGEQLNMHEYRNESGQTAYDRVQELSSQVEIRGMKLRQAMRFIIESDNYQGLMDVTEENSGPGHPRTKALSTLVNRYRASAKRQLFKEFPELKEDYRALLTR